MLISFVLHFSGVGPEALSTNERWSRPPVPDFDPTKKTLVFQQLDLDFYTDEHLRGMPGATSGPVPIIRMFGITETGHSIVAHIHGFAPYFYVPALSKFKAADCGAFRVCCFIMIL
jgi:DNA polymerase delta subunit 1